MSTLKVGTIQNHSNSATVATAESAGFLKQAALPAFQVRGTDANAKLDLTNNTFTDVPYNTLNAANTSGGNYNGFNVGGHYDLSNYRFKPTLAGKWWLHAVGYVTYSSDAPNSGFMRFWDGTQTQGNSYIRDGAGDGTYGTIEISSIFNMSGNGSDYLKIQVKVSNSTDSDFYYGGYLGFFEGYYLGA